MTKRYLVVMNIIAIVVAILNLRFFDNFTVSVVIVSLEIVVLIILLLRGKSMDFLCYYMIFLCLSLEVDGGGWDYFYGFKNFRIFGLNLGLICIFPVAIYSVIKYGRGIIKSERFHGLRKIIIFFIVMLSTSILMGLFNIVINDNNIRTMPGYLGILFNMLYMFSFPLFVGAVAFGALCKKPDDKKKLEYCIVAIIAAAAWGKFFSLIFQVHGSYSIFTTLVASLSSLYIPFLMLLPKFLPKNTYSKYIFVLGLSCTAISLISGPSGKLIILVAIVAVLSLILKVKSNNKVVISKRGIAVAAIFAIVLFNVIIVSYFATASKSSMLRSKLDQAVSMVNVFKEDWFENMPTSPKYRVVEFLNTSLEFLEKPGYFFLGKGLAGTAKDHMGFYEYKANGGFSDEQHELGAFYRLHETLNNLYLMNGLLGLCFWIYMFVYLLKNFTKSIFILIGGWWILLLYGYSITLAPIGMCALLLAFINSDIRRNKLHSLSVIGGTDAI